MRKLIILAMLMLALSQTIKGQKASDSLELIMSDVITLKNQQASMQSSISTNRTEITSLGVQNELSSQKIDSLNHEISILKDSVQVLKHQLTNDINQTNSAVNEAGAQLSNSIENKSTMFIVVLAFLAIVGAIVSFLLGKRVSKAGSSIENVKNAQSQLQNAQKKLEEESIQLDNKLLELIDKKIEVSGSNNSTDHTLALKVADEITRIELNLSRMDSSVKGHKQLSKAVERIKNNFMAKGYEIADMLGKPYNEGMRINADFVLDESLEPGTRTITSITKPQVVYNGEIIQKAIVTITQNI